MIDLLHPQDHDFRACLFLSLFHKASQKQPVRKEAAARPRAGGEGAAACGPLLRQPWRRRLSLLWPPRAQRKLSAPGREARGSPGAGKQAPCGPGPGSVILRRDASMSPHPRTAGVPPAPTEPGLVPSRHCSSHVKNHSTAPTLKLKIDCFRFMKAKRLKGFGEVRTHSETI